MSVCPTIFRVRVWEHETKIVPGFTRTYGLTKLVYFEEHASILEARERERACKAVAASMEIQVGRRVELPDWRDVRRDELVLL